MNDFFFWGSVKATTLLAGWAASPPANSDTNLLQQNEDKTNQIMDWAETLSLHCRGKSRDDICTSLGVIFSRSSHSKKVRCAVRPLQRAHPSLPCAVAQMGNDINDLYYQFHIMLYKCQQLGKKKWGFGQTEIC